MNGAQCFATACAFLISFVTFSRWVDVSCCTHTPACVSATGLFWLSKQVFKKKCATDSSCALMFSSLNLLVPTTNGPFLSWSVFAKVLHSLQNIDSISSSNTSHSCSRPWSSFFHADWNFLLRVCLSYCLNRSADWFSPDLTFFPWGFDVRQIAPHFGRSESRKCFAELSYSRDPITR